MGWERFHSWGKNFVRKFQRLLGQNERTIWNPIKIPTVYIDMSYILGYSRETSDSLDFS